MDLRGDIQVNKLDIKMYYGIYDLADNKTQKLDVELIPTFIIDESLKYFCNLEKYEICQKIKTFFESHPSYVVQSSREEWFGIKSTKKQKH